MEYFNVYRKFTGDRVAVVYCDNSLNAVIRASEVLNQNRRYLYSEEMDYENAYFRVIPNKVGDYVRMPDGELFRRVA